MWETDAEFAQRVDAQQDLYEEALKGLDELRYALWGHLASYEGPLVPELIMPLGYAQDVLRGASEEERDGLESLMGRTGEVGAVVEGNGEFDRNLRKWPIRVSVEEGILEDFSREYEIELGHSEDLRQTIEGFATALTEGKLTAVVHWSLQQAREGKNLHVWVEDITVSNPVTGEHFSEEIQRAVGIVTYTEEGELEVKVRPSSIPLTYVEGGTFQMGSDDWDISKPIHRVTVDSFYMGTYEVTQDIYEEVMGGNPSYIKGARLPVESVTWFEAVAFANALSRRDGLEEVYTIDGEEVICDWIKSGYRLPTEAEWEYAARGGKESKGYTYAGSNTIGDVAWYRDNSNERTQLVGTKSPNELGLYDMSGNVFEWCWDWWEYYTPSAKTNPTGPSTGSRRVLRGGSWYGYASNVRSAYRTSYALTDQHDNIGFRLVLPALVSEFTLANGINYPEKNITFVVGFNAG